ncbi:branched-chain amino acid ABC transporter permease [Microbacterium lushaniae]|nr:branched-chain amino acid ABC transporter permease [Microbacterium lushaniae]KAA9156305.1 branched-chain amino acid ABC transporter permease [Microbacterium lushaniae]
MTTVWAGLSIGAVYAIVAIGYNIVFIGSRVFNFAQAQFIMIGAFVGVVVSTQLDLPLWLAIILCAVVGGIVGALEEVLAVRWLRGRGAHNELVTTLGVATVLSGTALILFGSNPRRVGYFNDMAPIELLGGRLLPVEGIVIVLALLAALGIGLITRRTTIGIASLATSEDRQAGALRGINASVLAVGAFVAAGALLAALGPLIAAKTFAAYNLGDLLAVKAFVAVAIGGFGSYAGALIGGFGVGLLEVFAARYLGSEWQNITVFILLLIVLMVIPNGVLGKSSGRTV